MEVVGIENSRVIYLLDLFRPAGEVYQPDAVAKIIQRYSFVKFPSLENLVKNERVFAVGKFKDIQIAEFNIYTDGLIAGSSSDTDLIDDFVNDLIAWAKDEFGIIQVAGFAAERAYESTVIIKSNVDIVRALAPRNDISAILNKIYQPDRYVAGKMQLTGFIAASDRTEFAGRRKPISFIVDRRLGLPFEQNIFYSTAPLRTKDHLEVLRSIERLALTA